MFCVSGNIFLNIKNKERQVDLLCLQQYGGFHGMITVSDNITVSRYGTIIIIISYATLTLKGKQPFVNTD